MNVLHLTDKTKYPTTIFFVSFVISIFYILLPTFFVQAISVSPLKHTVVVDPGSTQDVSFQVFNDSNEEKTYVMDVEGFIVDAQSGRAKFGEMSPAQTWTSFPSGNTFTLSPWQKREVVATLSVPAGERPNTYYLGVFAQESAGKNNELRLGTRVGTLVFLTVAGTIVEDLRLDYVVPLSRVSMHSPVFQLQLSNNGTVVSPYSGIMTLTNISGREVGRVVLHDGVGHVFAGMKKVETVDMFQTSWRDIGPLRATVLIQYGIAQKMVSESVVVWYLPIWSYALCLVIVANIVWFLLYLKKRKQV
jgi:hypothetical protein